tara:strand:+ start:152 stop:343 length:192 start_codon:yes stop_codon:yes gene_type:complete
MKDNVDGLYVKDGRLINGRPCGITGIQEAAMAKASKKRARKVEEIAEGIRMAEAVNTFQFIRR